MISVKIFNIAFSRIITNFFDMNLLKGQEALIAKTMFDRVDAQLQNSVIPWDNFIGIGLDNINVNTIQLNLTQKKHKNIVVAACPCHIHNASHLFEYTCFYMNDHCEEKYILNEYFLFCEMEYPKVMKFISTYWLFRAVYKSRIEKLCSS